MGGRLVAFVVLLSLPVLLLLLSMVLSTRSQAQQRQVVIYRCTDASGALTIQNDVPCAKGIKQQKQTIDVPIPMPSYQPREQRMPTIVAREHAEAKAKDDAEIANAVPVPVAEAERQPPPPLFRCITWQDKIYLTETNDPPQRCKPMNVVGLDGRPMNGAAQICENLPDICKPVPEADLCENWQRQVDEAKFRWNFAGDDTDHSRELEYVKLLGTLENSNCGQ